MNGDTVLVEPGTYMENIDFLGKAITVESSDGAEKTVIDGGHPVDPNFGSVVTFVNNEGADSLLEGFTLTNGTGTKPIVGQHGGGVYMVQASPSLRNCIITKNGVSQKGGGLYLQESAPTIYGCKVTHNQAGNNGGGMFMVDAASCFIENSFIEDNTAYFKGGGIFMKDSSATIMACEVKRNAALSDGGGICSMSYGLPDKNLVITESYFTENSSQNGGGGILVEYTDLHLEHCHFSLNSAIEDGGGVMCNESGDCGMVDCWFLNNTSQHNGGGFYCLFVSCDISDCHFINNTTQYGGGGAMVHISNGNVKQCRFIGNRTDSVDLYQRCGGGLFLCGDYNGAFNVTECEFEGNTSGYGGGLGIAISGVSHVEDCSFQGNTADFGGGMEGSMQGEIIRCQFVENTANRDGGALRLSIESKLTDCLIHKNKAGLLGGGVYYSYLLKSLPAMTNCVLTENRAKYGGGMACFKSTPIVYHCTFNRNISTRSGGAVYNKWSSSSTFHNSILWGNEPQEIFTQMNASCTVSSSNVQGGFPGDKNIDADPMFVDPDRNDIHIAYDSPCRDAAYYEGSELPEFDFDGNPRLSGARRDMGADEFHYHLYCIGDFTPGGFVRGNIVGNPGTAPTALCIGSGLLSEPLQHTWGLLYLEVPFYVVPMGSIPVNGVLQAATYFPPLVPAPYEVHLQALIGNQLSDLCTLEVR
ncbi:MAG: right-handed parallel beta-helix repeat-containing protein [Planctomycetota bacterium]